MLTNESMAASTDNVSNRVGPKTTPGPMESGAKEVGKKARQFQRASVACVSCRDRRIKVSKHRILVLLVD